MTTSTPLSTLMRRLLTSYAVVFNRKYLRSGHLFQNRYKSIVCEEETYLLELVRYIHLNPLRAGLVKNNEELGSYPWCGHSGLMGYLNFEYQEINEILMRFDNNVYDARRKYSEYIADGISIGRCDHLVGGGLRRSQGENIKRDDCDCFDERILGSGSFVENLKQEEMLRDRITNRITLRELTQKVCSTLQLEPESVRVPSKARAPAEARGIICYIATRHLGYKGKELGRELQLGPTGVSIAVRRGEKLIIDKPELRKELLSATIDK